uniref:LIM zinc-binding domain-containing protein n=1 Tax=Maylandia zebra TaxID=106582 RepID=A0A3P9BPQ4_9CICH
TPPGFPQQKQKQKQGSSGGPVACQNCGKPCKGEALRVQNKHFHIKCFICKVCGCELAQGGFFVRQGDYICTLDYQRLYGTRCFSCQDFIEGEVVSALGKTYHPQIKSAPPHLSAHSGSGTSSCPKWRSLSISGFCSLVR